MKLMRSFTQNVEDIASYLPQKPSPSFSNVSTRSTPLEDRLLPSRQIPASQGWDPGEDPLQKLDSRQEKHPTKEIKTVFEN